MHVELQFTNTQTDSTVILFTVLLVSKTVEIINMKSNEISKHLTTLGIKGHRKAQHGCRNDVQYSIFKFFFQKL